MNLIKTEPIWFDNLYDKNFSVPCLDLLQKMLLKEQEQRPTSIQCITHPFCQKKGKIPYLKEDVLRCLEMCLLFSKRGALQLSVLDYFVKEILKQSALDNYLDVFFYINKTECGDITKEELIAAFNSVKLYPEPL